MAILQTVSEFPTFVLDRDARLHEISMCKMNFHVLFQKNPTVTNVTEKLNCDKSWPVRNNLACPI